MRRSLTFALLLAIVTSDLAIASGPIRRFFSRFRRRQITTTTVTVQPTDDATRTVLGQMDLAVIQAMHDLDCQYRNDAGLHSLELHSKLCEVAQAHAENMARKSHSLGERRAMDHYLDGSPWNRAYAAGWPHSASENIAYGYSNVAAAYNGWYHSRGHRINMLGNHTYCGFGYAVNSNGTPYWAAMYSD